MKTYTAHTNTMLGCPADTKHIQAHDLNEAVKMAPDAYEVIGQGSEYWHKPESVEQPYNGPIYYNSQQAKAPLGRLQIVPLFYILLIVLIVAALVWFSAFAIDIAPDYLNAIATMTARAR